MSKSTAINDMTTPLNTMVLVPAASAASAPAATSSYQSIDVPAGGATAQTDNSGLTSLNAARLRLASVLALALLLSFFFHASPAEWVSKHLIGDGCQSDECLADQATYRLSFAAFIFYFIHWVMSSPRNLCVDASKRVAFNNSHFFIKFVVAAAIAGLSFVPGGNNFFAVWAWIALVISVAFLIAQLLVLLEFAFSWSEDWSAREEPKYQKGLLAACVVLFIGTCVIIGLGFKFFGSTAICHSNQAALACTLVAGLLCLGLSIVTPRGSIVPACVVSIYCAWTCFNALIGRTDVPAECNTLNSSADILQVVISTTVTVGALLLSTLSAATSQEAFALSPQDGGYAEIETESRSLAHFHFMMMLASAYISMLVSNWSILGATAPSVHTFEGGGQTAMTAKFVTVGVCFALYLWTLVAPFILRNRQF